MIEEVWKDIPDFPGYQASNTGKIKVLSHTIHTDCGRGPYSYTVPERIMSTSIRSRYYCVTLQKNGKYKNELVHRLIAKTFLENPNNLPQVNHKDENKLNNNLENLEWCTRKYNMNYGTGKQRSKMKRRRRVVQYIDNYAKEWESINTAARGCNVSAGSIKSACDRGHRCCNYYWRYAQ